MKKFLITGAFGQDAFYLSKYIQRKKLGLVFGIHNKDDTKISKVRLRYFDEIEKLSLDDNDGLSSYIIKNNFDFIINVGAIASSLKQFDKPISLRMIFSSSSLLLKEIGVSFVFLSIV